MDRMMDRQDWKHYRPAPSMAGGSNASAWKTKPKLPFIKISFIFLGFKHGYLKGVIGVEYPLAEAKQAQIEVREHKKGSKGKIVINI